MNTSKLFYSKCRPQGCDAWPIAQSAKRAFVGYPVIVPSYENTDWRLVGCHKKFRNFGFPDWSTDWTIHLSRYRKAQATMNRNLASKLGAGSVVLIPRPADGVCHAGMVTAPFELVDYPDWADSYFDLRRKNGLDCKSENEHIGDISQTWAVSSWHRVPFTSIPRWISYRLLSRNTIGIIEDLPGADVSALQAIKILMDDPGRFPATNSKHPETGLLNWLNPSSFEHLIVSLLQLEAKKGTYWHHIGGSGDGGVDGIGVNKVGRPIGKLQVKWHFSGSVKGLFEHLEQPDVQAIVAVLHGAQEPGFKLKAHQVFWNRATVAKLIIKHKLQLPFARSLGL